MNFESLGHNWTRLSDFFSLQLLELEITVFLNDCSDPYTITWLTWLWELGLEDKYKVVITSMIKMQHCVPVGWEKDIKAGYLTLTSDMKSKADIQIVVPSKGKWHSSCSAFRSLTSFNLFWLLTFFSLAGSESYIFCCKLDSSKSRMLYIFM